MNGEAGSTVAPLHDYDYDGSRWSAETPNEAHPPIPESGGRIHLTYIVLGAYDYAAFVRRRFYRRESRNPYPR